MGETHTMRWKFEVELKDGVAFVYERQDGVPTYVRYGPMPPDFAGPFIDERKEALADACAAARTALITRQPWP